MEEQSALAVTLANAEGLTIATPQQERRAGYLVAATAIVDTLADTPGDLRITAQRCGDTIAIRLDIPDTEQPYCGLYTIGQPPDRDGLVTPVTNFDDAIDDLTNGNPGMTLDAAQNFVDNARRHTLAALLEA